MRSRFSKARIEAAANTYTTAIEAAHELGVHRDSFLRMCKRHGIRTPYVRQPPKNPPRALCPAPKGRQTGWSPWEDLAYAAVEHHAKIVRDYSEHMPEWRDSVEFLLDETQPALQVLASVEGQSDTAWTHESMLVFVERVRREEVRA